MDEARSGGGAAAGGVPGEGGPDAAAARAVARVRRLMMVSAATTVVAVAAVIIVIGYRLFQYEGSAAPAGAPAEVTETLPAGARVTAAAAAEDRLVVTIALQDGATELRSYDLKTLRPLARLRLAPQH